MLHVYMCRMYVCVCIFLFVVCVYIIIPNYTIFYTHTHKFTEKMYKNITPSCGNPTPYNLL